MVAVGELDLELHPREVRRGRPEHERVAAGVERLGERGDRPSSSVCAAASTSPPRQSSTRTPLAGRPAAVSRTCVETETLIARIFALACDGRGRSLSSSARTSAPPRTTSLPDTTSRSTLCGAESTSPATGSSAPPSSRTSRRQIARSAHLPRSSEPRSTRPRTAAPPRVPSRSASREVIASAPPRPRATSSACFTSSKRSPRSFDADPSTPSPTRTPASASSRTGATPAPSRRFEVGQCATPVPVAPKSWTVVRGEVDAVRAPHVPAEPPEVGQVLDRGAAVELEAVGVLLHRLGEVRVEHEAVPAGERGRLLHQSAGHGER